MSIHLLRRTGFMTKPGAGGPPPTEPTVFTDDFNGTPGQDLADRTGWTVNPSGSVRAVIDANGTRAETSGTSGTNSLYRAPDLVSPDDWYLSIIEISQSGRDIADAWRVVYRYEDENNYMYLRPRTSSTSYEWGTVINGVQSADRTATIPANFTLGMRVSPTGLYQLTTGGDSAFYERQLTPADPAGIITGILAREPDAGGIICSEYQLQGYVIPPP